MTKAPLLKAQHPEFELWSQGIHARSGVSCADCHMPYVREGAIKISDHHVRSPLLDAQSIARSCQTCHRYGEDEIRARAETIQARTRGLMDQAEVAVVDLIHTIDNARKQGASQERFTKALDLHRKAEWRLDRQFIIARLGVKHRLAELVGVANDRGTGDRHPGE